MDRAIHAGAGRAASRVMAAVPREVAAPLLWLVWSFIGRVPNEETSRNLSDR
jgi:hypothetical protein